MVGMISSRLEYADVSRGATVLVRHVDVVVGVDPAWIEPLMFGWRRAIIELDQIRSLVMVRLNDTLQRVAVINPQLAARVKAKVKYAVLFMNRNIDAFLTKRMTICGYDSMDQIIVDSTLRRLHYQINLMRAALCLLGDPQCHAIGITQSSRPLLFLTEKHVCQSRNNPKAVVKERTFEQPSFAVDNPASMHRPPSFGIDPTAVHRPLPMHQPVGPVIVPHGQHDGYFDPNLVGQPPIKHHLMLPPKPVQMPSPRY